MDSKTSDGFKNRVPPKKQRQEIKEFCSGILSRSTKSQSTSSKEISRAINEAFPGCPHYS